MKKITRLNALLTALGFTPDPNDSVSLLKWALEQAENYAKLQLNLPLIPAEAEKPLLNIAAGEYLKAKKALYTEEIKPLSPSPALSWETQKPNLTPITSPLQNSVLIYSPSIL